MTIKDYFGDWIRVIDVRELYKIIDKLNKVDPNILCPSLNNVFKAFKLCSYRDLKIVMIGMDPYPQKGVATGILFGNKSDVSENNISPSLQVIKEAVINYEIPHNIVVFDQTLESWAKQGILMLNSALTCEVNKVGSHIMLWRYFISKLLVNLSKNNTGLIYVLFGKQAQTFEPYINKQFNDIIKVEHPAYFARVKKDMPYSVFTNINNLIKDKYGTIIEWYQESN